MPFHPPASHFSRICLLLLLLVGAAPASATPPLRDRIVIDEHRGRIFPSECCWMPLPPSERLRAMKRAETNCSAIGGPVGVFEVRDRKLWLIGLHKCSGTVDLRAIYPELAGPALASWLSGSFKVVLDQRCSDSVAGPLDAVEQELQLDQGIVTSVTELSRHQAACAR